MLQSKIALICNVFAMLLALAMAIIAGVRWKSLPATLVARYDIDGRPNSWSGRGTIWFYPALTLVLLALTEDKMGPFNLFFAAMFFYQMLRTLQIADHRAQRLPPWFMPVFVFGTIALVLFIHL